jgi:hypothetical protein
MGVTGCQLQWRWTGGHDSAPAGGLHAVLPLLPCSRRVLPAGCWFVRLGGVGRGVLT